MEIKQSTLIRDLCEGQPQKIQHKIKAAYWQGCNEGMALAKSTDYKVDRKEGNVVFLKDSTVDSHPNSP